MSPKKIVSALFLLVLFMAFTFCRKPEAPEDFSVKDTKMVPAVTSADFPVSHNDHLAMLGRVLFYDKELSLNKNVSCGTCHNQANAFTDNKQFSPGTDNRVTDRNTPSIFSKNGRLFWDGRAFSLEDLSLRPVRNKVEMGIDNVGALVGRISSIDYYQDLIKKAFPNSPRIDSNMLKTAIAEFLRNFNFSDNKFHRSEMGNDVLTSSEELGRELFFGKAQCSNCHHITQDFGMNQGYGFTDESHNIGLDVSNPDKGVGAVTRVTQDEGEFMMPVLLNVALTAPYMHDGRFKTLEEVVDHYDTKIKNNPNLDPLLRIGSEPRKLNLTPTEKKGLVDFLKTLTDEKILTDSRFSDPFVPRKL
jgi:cytochrome c peroxidase